MKKTATTLHDKITSVFLNSHNNNEFNVLNHVCMKRGKSTPIADNDTPAGVAIGLIEIFAGSLLCIIPHPVTIGIGVGVIADGASRIVDAGVDLDQKKIKMSVFGLLKYRDQSKGVFLLNNL